MMSEAPWKFDETLRNKLLDQVRRSYSNKEMLSCMKQDFPMYQWSLSSLKRRLSFFEIRRNEDVPAPLLAEAVSLELDKPGNLGIRSMRHKVRCQYGLLAKRQDVVDVMTVLDFEGLQRRRTVSKRKLFQRRAFYSKGPNWSWHIDGHDKLMGRFKNEFPLGIVGMIDSFSRKILMLKIWPSNCNPRTVGNWFFWTVLEQGVVPAICRSDRGNENGLVALIQLYLRSDDDDAMAKEAHRYGSSVFNQAIERYWREYFEKHGLDVQSLLRKLVADGDYDPANQQDRAFLAFVFIPVLQKELDVIKDLWNSHRIRKQNIGRPCGIPEIIYKLPHLHGGRESGFKPSVQKLDHLMMEFQLHEEQTFLSSVHSTELAEHLEANGFNNVSIRSAVAAYKSLRAAFHNRHDIELSL